MTTLRTASIVVLMSAALAAPVALAQTNTPSQTQELSLSQIEARLSNEGYRVLEIERDDGHYEVKAWDPQGRCVELDINRRDGSVLRSKSDDDCGVRP